jgi:hypothetical protein
VHVNAKMIPVETIPRMGKGDKREMEGVNSRMIYLMQC